MISAFYALHYGSDYLGWSVKSIYDHVDRIYVLYTDRPSYGHQSNLTNPDNRQKMVDSAHLFGDPKGKIKWIDGHWNNEVEHRNAILSATSQDDADCIITVDADEIWTEKMIVESIEKGFKGGSRLYRAKMLTFWRSFAWTCTDEWGAFRLTFPKRNGGDETIGEDRVLHFGYARSIENIRYKVSIHGHKGEWRGEWLGRFENWPASGNHDLHPVCANAWTATPYDKSLLPELMKSHPYYNLEVIA